MSSHGSEPARSGTRDLLIASPTPEALRHKIKYILTSDCVQQRERDGVVPRAESLRQVFLRLMSRLVKLMGEKMLTFSCIRTSTSELDLPLHFILMLNTERQTHTHTHTHTHGTSEVGNGTPPHTLQRQSIKLSLYEALQIYVTYI